MKTLPVILRTRKSDFAGPVYIGDLLFLEMIKPELEPLMRENVDSSRWVEFKWLHYLKSDLSFLNIFVFLFFNVNLYSSLACLFASDEEDVAVLAPCFNGLALWGVFNVAFFKGGMLERGGIHNIPSEMKSFKRREQIVIVIKCLDLKGLDVVHVNLTLLPDDLKVIDQLDVRFTSQDA